MATSDAKPDKTKSSYDETIKDLERAFNNIVKELTPIEKRIIEKENYLNKVEEEYKERNDLETGKEQKTSDENVVSIWEELLNMEVIFKKDGPVKKMKSLIYTERKVAEGIDSVMVQTLERLQQQLQINQCFLREVRKKYEEVKKRIDAAEEAEESLLQRVVALLPLVEEKVDSVGDNRLKYIRLLRMKRNEGKECSELQKAIDTKEECSELQKIADTKEEECSELQKIADTKEEECSELQKIADTKEEECSELQKIADTKEEECSELQKIADTKEMKGLIYGERKVAEGTGSVMSQTLERLRQQQQFNQCFLREVQKEHEELKKRIDAVEEAEESLFQRRVALLPLVEEKGGSIGEEQLKYIMKRNEGKECSELQKAAVKKEELTREETEAEKPEDEKRETDQEETVV